MGHAICVPQPTLVTQSKKGHAQTIVLNCLKQKKNKQKRNTNCVHPFATCLHHLLLFLLLCCGTLFLRGTLIALHVAQQSNKKRAEEVLRAKQDQQQVGSARTQHLLHVTLKAPLAFLVRVTSKPSRLLRGTLIALLIASLLCTIHLLLVRKKGGRST